MNAVSGTRGSLAVLRQFVRRTSLLETAETCELCAGTLASHHQHLLDPVSRKIICACDACAILFSRHGQTKYKRIPRRVQFLGNFQMTAGQWDGLRVPINMAFFFRSTPGNQVIALYPGPAGATESPVPLDAWERIELVNPAVREMDADVEALLVNRLGPVRGFTESEYYLVPIDECFKLVGLIRAKWQGLSGGSELWREIGRFFGDLKGRSTGTVV